MYYTKPEDIAHFFAQVTPNMSEDDIRALILKVYDHQQSKIDELMMEYCVDEITPEQWTEFEKHQHTINPFDLS